MRKVFLRVSCAVSVLLAFGQFAAAQGSTTEFDTNPLINKTNSAQPDQGPQGNDLGRGGNDWDLAARSEADAGPGVNAHPEASLYPGEGTTLNRMPVYVSAQIKLGDRIQTGRASGSVSLGTVSLDMGLNSVVLIQEPLVLRCGVVTVRSGTIAINDGNTTLSFTNGQTAYAAPASCEGELPNSPDSVQGQEDRGSTNLRSGSAVAARSALFDTRVVDWSFVAANTAMFGSSVAAAETTHRCLQAGACTFVPDTFHRRRNMYLAGMPVAAGISYLSFYLKEKGHRWWFVPAAVVTVGNLVVITHAARNSR